MEELKELSRLFNAPVCAVGAEELGERLTKGESVECANCGGSHPVELAEDRDGNETNLLMTISCGGKSFVAGIAGKRLQ